MFFFLFANLCAALPSYNALKVSLSQRRCGKSSAAHAPQALLPFSAPGIACKACFIFRGSKRAIWGIGFRVFSAFDNGVLSVRPAKTEIRHSLLVPLNAPAHKVPNDTPAVKLAGYTVRQESVLRSNSHLGVSVLLAGAYKGNTKPANEISVLCPGEQHRTSVV